jgi:hypothetical protein
MRSTDWNSQLRVYQSARVYAVLVIVHFCRCLVSFLKEIDPRRYLLSIYALKRPKFRLGSIDKPKNLRVVILNRSNTLRNR